MILEQGVRYVITAAKKAAIRRTKGPSSASSLDGLVSNEGYDPLQALDAPQINYVLDTLDSNADFGADFSLASNKLLDKSNLTVRTGTFAQSGEVNLDNLGHHGLSFYGAPQTTFNKILYNEVLGSLLDDTMYLLQSSAQVNSGGQTYSHGQIFTATSTAPTRVSGSPVLVKVFKHGESTSGDRFYVYGDQAAIDSGASVVINDVRYFPGDVVTSGGQITASDSSANIALVPTTSSEDNVNMFQMFYSSNSVELGDNDYDYDGISYLIYDNVTCRYNDSTIKIAIHSNNVFKTTNESIYTQPERLNADTHSLGRKKPLIREVVKSGDIEAGETYFLYSNEVSGFSRQSFLSYNDAVYNSSENLTSFNGVQEVTNYFPSSRKIDKTKQDLDSDLKSNLSMFSEEIDITSGNVMVVKKEPVGLKAGQKYVMVAAAVSYLEQDEYYVLSRGRAIVYDGVDVTLGEVFKAGSTQVWQAKEGVSDGKEEVTLVTNSIEVQVGGTSSTTYTTTIKNRKIEFTPSDNSNLSNSSVMIQWKSTGGRPYVYPVVSELQKEKEYFVAAEGDGRIIYPPKELEYKCVSAFSNDQDFEKLTENQLVYSGTNSNDTYKKCVDLGGRWQPETEEYFSAIEILNNRDSFLAAKGKCIKGSGEDETLFESLETEAACVDEAEASTDTTWSFHNTFKEVKDSLNVYASETTEDLKLPIKIIAKPAVPQGREELEPTDTSVPELSNLTIEQSTYPLRPEQVIRFPQQTSNGALPCFIIKQPETSNENNNFNFSKNQYGIGATSIMGYLLYDSLPKVTSDNLGKRTGVLSLQTSDSIVDQNGVKTSSSPCYYYAEPIEITVSSSVSESDNAQVEFNSLPVKFNVGEIIFLEHSSGNCQLKVSSHEESTNTITGKLRCPHGSSLPAGAKAKISNKKVGYYSVNTKFKSGSVVKGVSGKPVLRFKSDTLLKPLSQSNIESLEAATGSVREVVSQTEGSVVLNSGTYTLRGHGFVFLNDETYYPKAEGTIKVDHENGSGSYYEYGELSQSSLETTIKIEESAIHVPSGKELVFPNGRFVLTENINLGDALAVGKFVNSGDKVYHGESSSQVSFSSVDLPALNSQTSVTVAGNVIICNSQKVEANDDQFSDGGSRPEKYYVISADASYFVESDLLTVDGTNVQVYADYFIEEEIYSGNKFEIVKRIDKERDGKIKLNFGEINGSESRYDYDVLGEDGETACIYMLPTSPCPHIESFGKVYKLSHDYRVNGSDFTGESEYTYKVGGKGEGYVSVGNNDYSIGSTFSSSSSITLNPSSPVVYEKQTTTLEPNKYYVVESPENLDYENLTTIQYNNKNYFADISYQKPSTKTIKYNNTTYNIRHFNLSSYIFGRIQTPFMENVRNYKEGLGKILLKEITATGKIDTELENTYRFFDIINNDFTNFNILRSNKIYNKWGKFKLTEQAVDATKTQVPIVGGKLGYEFSISRAIEGGNISNPYNAQAPAIKAVICSRLLDTEFIQDDVQELKYRVESSYMSEFSVSDSNPISVSRSVSPVALNRLRVGRYYYLKQGKIDYLSYNSNGVLDTNTPIITIDSTTSGKKIFSGKSDAFSGDNRILFGSETHIVHRGHDALNSQQSLQSSLAACRMGAFEYWNIKGNSPLVYPVINPWEIEQSREYYIDGDADVDAIEYNGKVYKPGETFKGSRLTASRPLSVDTGLFESQLSPADLKQFSSRAGAKPWMDDASFRPRERGFIELTPLLYKSVSNGSIKAGQKYIVYKDSSGGSVNYNGQDYTAKNAIAHADNFIDVTSTATLNGGNWKVKLEQGEKITDGTSYQVYGSGKIKYVAQVKSSSSYSHGASVIQVASVPVAISKFTILEFSNGSTFTLGKDDVDVSSGAVNLSGSLTGDLPSGTAAPITESKSNQQVTVKASVSMSLVNGSYEADRTTDPIKIKPLPFNMAAGEVLYFTNGIKLSLSRNSSAGSEDLYGKLEHPTEESLSAEEKADIIYEREVKFQEYQGGSGFGDTFEGVEGFDYFEIIEGEPEVYTAIINDNGQSHATVGEGRYYLFGTSTQNSTTPSNVFYGVSGQTGFTANGGATVLQVVELQEATDNYNAGIEETYFVYGSPDDSRNLISIKEDYGDGIDYYHLTNGAEITKADIDGNNTEWDTNVSDWEFVKYRDPSETQLPPGPVVYVKKLKILSSGQKYDIQSLYDPYVDNEHTKETGVIKYIEMGGTCKKIDGTAINQINDASDCVLHELIRCPEPKAPGTYTDGIDFELKINNLDFYKTLPANDVTGSFSGSYIDDNGNEVSETISFTVRKYLVCKQGQPMTFENGAIFIPSEDIYINGEYILDETYHPINPVYLYSSDSGEGDFIISPENLNACSALNGSWVQQDGDYVCMNYTASNTILNYYILHREWMTLKIKGEVLLPHPLKELVSAPLLLWEQGEKDAYFTTDGSEYNNSYKKVKNGEIQTPTEAGYTGTVNEQYTVSGGYEIFYNGQRYRIGQKFDGVSGETSWTGTLNSNGGEYITTKGTETSFAALSSSSEIEIISGNPIIFREGTGFVENESPLSSNVDDMEVNGERLIVEGGPIKIVEDLGRLSNLDYSEEDCGNKITSQISPRTLGQAEKFSPGKFTATSDSSYKINPASWESDTWIYNSEGAIRSIKLHDAFVEGNAFAYLSESSYRVIGFGSEDYRFLEAGITECENYVDLELSQSIDESDITINNGGVLFYEGFRIPYAPKSRDQFPEVEPYGGLAKSQTDTRISERFSELINLYAGYVVKNADAFVFGKGEIALHDLKVNSELRSTQRIRAYSNLFLHTSNSTTISEGPITTNGIEESYRYIISEGQVTLPVITATIKASYHSRKFDSETLAVFGFDLGLDQFKNSLSNGIRFKKGGYKEIPDTKSITFTSEIALVGQDASAGTLTVQPLPVNLEAGEIVERDSNNYITLTESANVGATSIKATLTGEIGNGKFNRVVTLSHEDSVYDSSNDALRGTLSPNHNRNNITSLTDGQIADTPNSWISSFGKGERFAAAVSLTQTEVQALKTGGSLVVQHSNVIPKSIFEGDYNSGRSDIALKHPKIEYTNGDVKILFKPDTANDGLTQAGEHFVDTAVDASDDGIGSAIENWQAQFIRYHLYDNSYSGQNLATASIVDGGITKTITAKNNFFIYDGSGSIEPISSTGLNIKSKEIDLGSEIYIYREVLSGEIVAGRKYLVYGRGSIFYHDTQINADNSFEIESGSEEFYTNVFIGNSERGAEFDSIPYYETYWDPTNDGTEVGDGSYPIDIPINKRQRRVCSPKVYELVYSKDYDGRSNLSAGDICYVYGEGGVKYKDKPIYATNKYIAVSTQNWDDSDGTPSETNYQIFPESFVYGGSISPTIGHEYEEEQTGIINPVHGIYYFAENKFTEGSLTKRQVQIDRDTDVVFYRKVHALEGLKQNKEYYIFSNNLEKHPEAEVDEDTGILSYSSTITVSQVDGEEITVSALPCNLYTGEKIKIDDSNYIEVRRDIGKGSTKMFGEVNGSLGSLPVNLTRTVNDSLSTYRSSVEVGDAPNSTSYTPRGSKTKVGGASSGYMSFASATNTGGNGMPRVGGGVRNSIIALRNAATVKKAGVFKGITPIPWEEDKHKDDEKYTSIKMGESLLEGSTKPSYPLTSGLVELITGEGYFNSGPDSPFGYPAPRKYLAHRGVSDVEDLHDMDTKPYLAEKGVGEETVDLEYPGRRSNVVTTNFGHSPAGSFIVKGGGYILYPVNADGSNIDFELKGLVLKNHQYGTISADAKKHLRKINKYTYRLTRRIAAGEVFRMRTWDTFRSSSDNFAITESSDPELRWDAEASAFAGRLFSQHFVKGTGNEQVYRMPLVGSDHWYWRGLDTFRDIAPNRVPMPLLESKPIHLENETRVQAGISYRVMYAEGYVNDEIVKPLYLRGEEGDSVDYSLNNAYFVVYYEVKDGEVVKHANGAPKEKKYHYGEVFVGVSGYPMFQRSNPRVFVRKESGTYGNAPEQGWSNQWSMFMTSINSGPENNTTSLWHDSIYGDVMGFLHNRCHLHSLDFQSNRYGHLLQTFAYGIKPVKRSEAAPGYTFLEGSNAQQSWFSIVWASVDDAATLQTQLNDWFFESCQVYRPDYIIDTVKCIDIGQDIRKGLKGKMLPFRSPSFNERQSGICWVNNGVSGANEEKDCYKEEGAWLRLRDRVEVTLNRRLGHARGTYKPKENVSLMSLSKLKKIRKAIRPGISSFFKDKASKGQDHLYKSEPFRTDENALIEYLIKQRKYIWKSNVPGHVYEKNKSISDGEGYFIQMQCAKARIGDTAPDMNVWYDPDDPWGACAPRFYFTKLVPYAFDNNTGKASENSKSAVSLKQFQQMEMYLRGMSGGFIDQESDPTSDRLDYGGNVELHELSRSIPVCTLSKDYDYLFENLAFQSLDNNPKLTSKEACEAIGGTWDEDQKTCSVINYQNVEVFYDQEDLHIFRQRKYKIERRLKLPALSQDGSYSIVRLGERFKVNGKVVFMSFTPETIGQSSTFKDVYIETVIDAGRRKNYNIPINQSYTVYRPDGTSFSHIVDMEDTRVLEDIQSKAQISWPNKGAREYTLQSKSSPISSIGDWTPVSEDTYFTLKKTHSYENFTIGETANWREGDEMEIGFNCPELSQYQQIEFRVKVYRLENPVGNMVLQGGRRFMLATMRDKNAANPIPVAWTNENEIDGSSPPSLAIERSGYIYYSKKHKADVPFAELTRIRTDAEVGAYVNIKWAPYLFEANGVIENLKYKIEFRIHTVYPNDYDVESEWKTIAKFKTPKNSTITYTDKDIYEFENISYRVLTSAPSSSTSRWISPMLRYDRMIQPDSPIGYGPLQNIKLRAALFNQFSNAINLLREVRMDIPIQVRHKEIVKQWIKKDKRISNDDNSDVLLCGGDYGDTVFTNDEQDSTDYREELPRMGYYAHHEMMPACPKVLVSSVVGSLASYKLNQSRTVAGEFIGEFEGDWNVESGYFSVCASKGFGYYSRPWMDSGGTAWIIMLYQQNDIKIEIPRTQSSAYAIPYFMRPLMRGEQVKISGLLENHSGESKWTKSNKGYYEVKEEDPSLAESMVFCRDLADHGGEGDHVYGFYGEGQHRWWFEDRQQKHTSRCKDIIGALELRAPELGTSDTGLIGLPGGNISFNGTKHVCPKGGAFSTQCFSTRASTGDNNMTMKIPVFDKVRFLPFSNATEHDGGTGSFLYLPYKFLKKPDNIGFGPTVKMVRMTEWLSPIDERF